MPRCKRPYSWWDDGFKQQRICKVLQQDSTSWPEISRHGAHLQAVEEAYGAGINTPFMHVEDKEAGNAPIDL